MKSTQYSPMTKSELNAFPSETYAEVREAYYSASDAIYGLEDAGSHLGEHERKAIEQIKRAFEALNHLGKNL
ncbi:MAG: hypothetical protein V2I43_27020 [Parvularcula sp.]|jgi:hypothetical protein|nr:hypothetical protein [Parvularcula sp.]